MHIISSMAASYGGPSHALAKMHIALNRLGVQSSIAAIQDPEEGDLVSAGGEVNLFAKQGPSFYYYSKEFELWLSKNISNYDLVHIHSFFSYPALITCYYARKMRKPYILRPFGTLDRYCMGKHFLRKRVYFELCERRNLNCASVIHCTSASEKEEIARFNLKSKSVVIPLGVENLPKGAGQRFKKKEIKHILFLSRLDPKKGLELLFQALSILKETRKDFCLFIAGSGETSYLASLKKKVRILNLEESVNFLGAVSGEKKEEMFRVADLFILPSYRENFGLSVVEAMAAGCPVVISDQVAIHREVAAYGAGLIASLTPEDISLKINNLLSDDQTRFAMGRRGPELVREQFDLMINVQKLVCLYKEILSENNFTYRI